MKIYSAVVRIEKATDKITGLVVIVPDSSTAKRIAGDLDAQNFDTYRYAVLEAAYYDGEIA